MSNSKKPRQEEDFDILNWSGLESDKERAFRVLREGVIVRKPMTWEEILAEQLNPRKV